MKINCSNCNKEFDSWIINWLGWPNGWSMTCLDCNDTHENRTFHAMRWIYHHHKTPPML